MIGLIGYIAVLSRGVVAPLVDCSLVPFCSNLVACMRVNVVLRKMVPGLEFVPLLSRADSPALMGGRSTPHRLSLDRNPEFLCCADEKNGG